MSSKRYVTRQERHPCVIRSMLVSQSNHALCACATIAVIPADRRLCPLRTPALLAFTLLVLALAACTSAPSTVGVVETGARPTPTPVSTVTLIPTPTLTVTSAPIPTPAPTGNPTPTPTPTPTPSPMPTPTPTLAPTGTLLLHLRRLLPPHQRRLRRRSLGPRSRRGHGASASRSSPASMRPFNYREHASGRGSAGSTQTARSCCSRTRRPPPRPSPSSRPTRGSAPPRVVDGGRSNQIQLRRLRQRHIPYLRTLGCPSDTRRSVVVGSTHVHFDLTAVQFAGVRVHLILFRTHLLLFHEITDR